MAASIRDLLSYRLAVLANLNDRSGHAHLKESFGLTLSAWRVLGNIAHHKRASFSGIANAMSIDKGQLSRTVSALVSRGLIAASATPGDRRGVTLSLTPEGARFHVRVLAFAVERNAALLSCLSKPEQRAFNAMLEKLATFIEVEHAALSFGNARDAETAARKATVERRTA
jgi:DNA-binding MarR family transcriptional regulator